MRYVKNGVALAAVAIVVAGQIPLSDAAPSQFDGTGSSEWSGTMSCGELLVPTQDEARRRPFTGPVTMRLSGGQAVLGRAGPRIEERLEGKVGRDGSITLAGNGHFTSGTSASWRTQASLTVTDDRYVGKSTIWTADGATKTRDCRLELSRASLSDKQPAKAIGIAGAPATARGAPASTPQTTTEPDRAKKNNPASSPNTSGTARASYGCGTARKPVFLCLTGKGKAIQVCDAGSTIDYSFGAPGSPEIDVRATRAQVSTLQWQGVGRWESYEVGIPNGSTTYNVFWGRDRLAQGETIEAGVRVEVNKKAVATVSCAAKEPIVQNMVDIDLPRGDRPAEGAAPSAAASPTPPTMTSSAPGPTITKPAGRTLIGGWECLLEGRRDLRRAAAYFEDGTFLMQGDGGGGQTVLVTGPYTWRDNRLTDTESIGMVIDAAGNVLLPWKQSVKGNDLDTTNYKIHEFAVTWDATGGFAEKRLRTSTGTGVSEAAPASEPATTCVRSDAQFARLKRIRDTVPPNLYGPSPSGSAVRPSVPSTGAGSKTAESRGTPTTDASGRARTGAANGTLADAVVLRNFVLLEIQQAARLPGCDPSFVKDIHAQWRQVTLDMEPYLKERAGFMSPDEMRGAFGSQYKVQHDLLVQMRCANGPLPRP